MDFSLKSKIAGRRFGEKTNLLYHDLLVVFSMRLNSAATAKPTATPSVFASITPTPKVNTPTPSTAPCNCNGPDLDCKDFATQAQAQTYYNYCKAQTGRDVFQLDADNDGIACESNA